MSTSETILSFHCMGHCLFGVLNAPALSSSFGVLIIGRSWSDRGGVHLARACAQSGIASFRFDFRGRGDSEGPVVSVLETGHDLKAAIDAFKQAMPTLQEVAVWGLSEGASAALLYAPKDPTVVGVVLVNPWIRMELAVAKRHLKQNVGQIGDRAIWDRIRQSEGGYFGAARSFARLIRNVVAAPKSSGDLKEQVMAALTAFKGPVCLILSGQDPATEIFQSSAAQQLELLDARGRLSAHTLADANHVFSRSDWRAQLASWTVAWAAKQGFTTPVVY